MGFFETAEIFSFLFVTVLQISILFLMTKRKWLLRNETIFAFLTFSALTWDFCIFVSLFCGYLYRGGNAAEHIFGSIALLGFTMFHPLLVHSLINFIDTRHYKLKNSQKYPVLIGVYFPTVVWFAWPIIQTIFPAKGSVFELREDFLASFSVWASVLMVIAWAIVIKLCRSLEEEEERSFLSILDWLVTTVIGIYFITFVLNVRLLPHVGNYLSLTSQILVSLFPTLFAYYLYRYAYMEYIVKLGVIYTFLGILGIVLYTSLIGPMGQGMEKHFNINLRILQGILVMGMVFFFDPLKRGLQELLNKVLFRQSQYYRTVFSDLSKNISRRYMAMDDLLDYIASTIARAMQIREVSIVFFRYQKEQLEIIESTLAILPFEIKEIVEYIKAHRSPVLNIYDLNEEDAEIYRHMKSIKAFTIIPIYHENALVGMLNIGKRRVRNHLLAEEEEMLIILINHMVTMIENTRLAREKFALERKMYENEKLSSLGRMSASIAHEVKNPLSSIKAITQVMKEDLPIDDANQEGLDIIVGEINRLSRVVDQLLHFARPHKYSQEVVRVDQIIVNVMMLLKYKAKKNEVEIQNNLTEDIKVISDQDSLMEIFFNLLNNAIQSLSQGGTVIIDGGVEEDKKNQTKYWVITITDNGVGILLEDRQKVFEPFYTTKQTGTGLGLAIVKKRLQKLKGDISIGENNPGAVFIVKLLVTHEDKVTIPSETQAIH